MLTSLDKADESLKSILRNSWSKSQVERSLNEPQLLKTVLFENSYIAADPFQTTVAKIDRP